MLDQPLFSGTALQGLLERCAIGTWRINSESGNLSADNTFRLLLNFIPAQDIASLDNFRTYLDKAAEKSFTDFLEEINSQGQSTCELTFSVQPASFKYFSLKGYKDTPHTTDYIGIIEDISPVKTQQENILYQHQQLNELHSLAKLGHWELNYQTFAITWSKALFKSFGLDPDTDKEPSYEEFARLIHPDDRASLRNALNQSAQTGLPYELEVRQLQPNNSYKWNLVKGKPIHDEYGKIITFIGINFDINERKVNEEKLKRFRRVLEQTSDAIFIIDVQTGKFIDVNDSACHSLAYTRDELLQLRVPDITLDEDIQVKERIAFLKNRKGILTLVNSLHRRKDGTTFPVELSLAYEEYEDNAYIIGIARDITERNSAQESLIKSEALLKSIFENTTDEIWSIDSNYLITYLNSTLQQHIKDVYDIWLETGNNILDAFKKANQSEIDFLFKERYDRALQGEAFSEVDYYNIDGTDLYLEIKFNPMVHENKVIGASVFSRVITEQKQAEANLIKERNFVSAIVETSGSLIVLFDKDGRIAAFNKACQLCTGYTPEEVIGAFFWDFLLVAEEKEEVKDLFQELASGHFPNRHENYWLSKNGEKRWIAWDNNAILDTDGDVEYVVGTGIDITERKQAEEALHEQKILIETFINNLPFECWARDIQEKVILQNEIDIKNWGNLMGSLPDHIIVENSVLEHWKNNNSRALAGEVINQEVKLAYKAKEHYVHEIIAPIWNNQQIKGIIGVNIDISERMQAKEALQASEERLRLALESAEMGTWEWDMRTNKLIWSERACNIYGVQLTVFEGTLEALMKMVYPEDMVLLEESVKKLSEETDNNSFHAEHRIIHPNKQIRWVEGFGKVYRDDQKQPIYMLGTVRDITARKKSENALKTISERLQSAFEGSQSSFYIYEAVLDDNNECIDFALIDINRLGLQMITLTKDELIGAKMREVTPGVVKLGLFEKFIHVYNTGQPLDTEAMLNLERFKASCIHVTCIKLEKGIFIAIRDISEKKAQENLLIEAFETEKLLNEELASREEELTSSEEELRQNLEVQNQLLWEIQQKEANLSALINNTNNIIFSIDTNYELVEFNIPFRKAVEYELGFRPEKGQNISGFNKNNLVSNARPYIEKALAGTKSQYFFPYLTMGGDDIYIEVSYHPIISAGEIIGVSMVARNITKMKKAELALQDSELVFKLISEVSTDAIWDWKIGQNSVHYISGYNKISQFVELNSEHTDGFWDNDLYAEDKDRVLNKLKYSLDTPDIYEFEDEYRVYKLDGTLACILEKAKIIRDAAGKAMRMVGGMQDVTQIREQHNKIIEALETERRLNEELAAREEELTSSEEELLQLNEQLMINYKRLEDKEFILSKAQSMAKIGSWEYNLIDKTIFWSDEMYNIYDVSKDFIPTIETSNRFFTEETNVLFHNAINNLEYARKEIDFTVKINTSSHQIKWIKVQAYPTFEKDKLVKLTGMTHDITDFRIAEEKLRSSEEKFSKAFDLSPDLLIIIRQTDLIIVETNSNAQGITGYTKEELIGKPIESFNFWVNPKERIVHREQYQRTGIGELEVTYKRKDSSTFEAIISSRKVEIEGLEYQLNVVRDITEKKIAAEKIKQSEINLNAIINNTDMSIWSIDRDYRIITLNDAFTKGIKSTFAVDLEIGSSALDERLPEHFRNYWKPLYTKALQGENVRFEQIDPQLDTYFKYSLNAMYADEEVTGVAVYAENIKERILREQQIQQNALALAESNKKMGEYKLMALRSVMNPHFIFNSLNSIQYFIARNDKLNAINYMSYFSKLIRGVLNSSIKNKVFLSDELDLLKYYIELELVRFEDKFDVVYDISPELDIDNIEIPSLLIQPFVENAILHGLYNKTGRGLLQISVRERAGILLFEVEDDGIGREAAAQIKANTIGSHKSVGMILTKERLEIINQEHSVSVEITDLYTNGQPCGTKVKIFLKI